MAQGLLSVSSEFTDTFADVVAMSEQEKHDWQVA